MVLPRWEVGSERGVDGGVQLPGRERPSSWDVRESWYLGELFVDQSVGHGSIVVFK
jgi:hypothetical protein